jgi:peptide/nickel transport system substrate-binding protein
MDRPMIMDRRTFLRTGLAAAGTALLCASCGKPSHPTTALAACPVDQPCARPTIRQPYGGIGGFPSPFAYVTPAGYALAVYIYDTLLWNDTTGAFLPWLASSYTRSPDGMTYAFQLRPDVRWHDGHPFSAQDVVFSFDYTEHFAGPPRLGVPSIPATVTATGPLSVEIRLTQPLVTFEALTLATLPIIPQHIWSSISSPAKVNDLAALVGTGPYRLTSYSSTQGTYGYEANDGFYLGKPFVKAIEYLVPANSDQLLAVLDNQIDGGSAPAAGVPPSALNPFRNNPEYGIITFPNGFATTLRWNLARGAPFNDVAFRRACVMSIDTKAMVTRLLAGDGDPGNPGYLSPTNPYYDPSVTQYPYNPVAAGRLLDQAGYKMGPSGTRLGLDGKPLSFPLLITSDAPAAGELVVSYLGAVGISLSPQEVDTITLFGRLPQGDYDMAVGFAGGGTSDPDLLRQHFCNPGVDNFEHVQGYDNPTLNALGNRQLVTLDTTTRRQLVDQMQAIIATDIPLVPLYYATSYFVYRAGVFDQWGNLPPSVGGGPSYNSNKEPFVFGIPTGLKVRPELA